MNQFSVFFLILLLHSCLSNTICPLWIGEAGHNYKIIERFNAVRKDNNELTATHVHLRGGNSNEEYSYKLNFCGEINSPAVIQTEVNGVKNSTKIIGKIDNSSILVGGEDVLLVKYQHGDNYNEKGHCNGKQRNAWVILRCEEDGEKPVLKVIEEGRYSAKDLDVHTDTPCYILFEFNHPGACSNFVKASKLSAGAIFCIIFISIAAAYLVFGFIYRRCIVGAKGYEQIPNFNFWRKVGNASADGCDYVCRRQEQANTYKGMANAADIDSSDHENDESLLPV